MPVSTGKYLYIIFAVLGQLAFYTAKGQLGIGFNLGAIQWFNSDTYTPDGELTGLNTPSGGAVLGLEANCVIVSRIRAMAGVDFLNTISSYSVIDKYSAQYYGDNCTVYISSPAQIYRFDVQYALSGNFKKTGWVFYGFAGLSKNVYFYKEHTETQNSSWYGYSGSSWEDYNKTFKSFSVEGGLCAEYHFDNMAHLFLSLKASSGQKTIYSNSIPAYENVPEHFSPAYFRAAIGVRFSLWESKNQ